MSGIVCISVVYFGKGSEIRIAVSQPVLLAILRHGFLVLHVTSRHDTCDVSSVSSRACSRHGGRRGSSSACVYKFSLLCSGFASVSGTTYGESESEVDMSTPVTPHCGDAPEHVTRVVRVALVVTSVSRRAVRQARHNTSRLFPVPKCMG